MFHQRLVLISSLTKFFAKHWHKLRSHLPKLEMIAALSTIVLGAAALWSVHISYKALDDARHAAETVHQDNIDALRQAHRDSNEALRRAHEDANISLQQLRSDNAAALAMARNANAEAAEASRIQARLTSESNAINKEALTAVQRAFIVVDQLGSVSVGVPVPPKGEMVPGEFFFPVIQNSGNTPAIITKAILITPRTRMDMAPRSNDPRLRASSATDSPPDPSALLHSPSTMDATIISNAVLGPKGMIQPVEGFGADTISVNDAFRVMPNTFGPYFFGAIEYSDIFNSKHIEMYCFRINNLIVRGGTGTHIQPARCSHWNCADTQCDADRESYTHELADVPKAIRPNERAALPLPQPPPPPPVRTYIVFFDFNGSNLTEAARAVVAEAVKTARTNGVARVRVTGHTDTAEQPDEYSVKLSVDRAQAVKDEMVRDGFAGNAITTEGKGFHDPLVPTKPGVREPQNRRAVIDLASTP